MKHIKFNRIFQIVYPLIVYFAIYQLGFSVLYGLMGEKYGALLCMLIAGVACLIPMTMIYRRVPHLIPSDNVSKEDIVKYVLYVVAVVALGLVVNVIITQLGVADNSKAFETASKTLSDGSFAIKILCNVMVVPILEELLIRGIIAGQICLWHGNILAIIISSIFFGILHNNSVQFIYALIIGLALGFMYVKTKRLSLCMLAHGLINFLVIIFANL